MSSAYADVDSQFDSALYSPHLHDQDSDMYAYMNLPWPARKAHSATGMLQYHQHPAPPLSIYIPPPHHHHPVVIHSPAPQHHPPPQQHVDEWSHGVYPVKQEDLSSYNTYSAMQQHQHSSHQGHHQHQHQTPQQQQSPSHLFVDLSAGTTAATTHYDYHSQRYVHPADVSPVESPLSPLQLEYPISRSAPTPSSGSLLAATGGCDPRFVSGDLSAVVVAGVEELDLDRANPAVGATAGDYHSQSSLTPEPTSSAAAAPPPPSSAGCTTPEDYRSPSLRSAGGSTDDYEDYDENEDDEEDYDDDRDGDFTLGRSRRNNTSTTSSRRKSSAVGLNDRYNPYAYPSSSSYDDSGMPILPPMTTRTRRTISNATASSTSSASSSSASYPPDMLGGDGCDSPDPQSPRKRNRNSSNLPAPIPIPNLTKKSRGRRVPTLASLQYGSRITGVNGEEYIDLPGGRRMATGKGARVHMCKVPGCGKCFARGEHLKRHVRSIHTYEKPHKCPYPGCGKDFSRHDNLGQHMRVHKDYVPV